MCMFMFQSDIKVEAPPCKESGIGHLPFGSKTVMLHKRHTSIVTPPFPGGFNLFATAEWPAVAGWGL